MKIKILIVLIIGILFACPIATEASAKEIHRGDLVVKGNEVYIIEDKELLIVRTSS